jgi:hypothetical protein
MSFIIHFPSDASQLADVGFTGYVYLRARACVCVFVRVRVCVWIVCVYMRVSGRACACVCMWVCAYGGCACVSLYFMSLNFPFAVPHVQTCDLPKKAAVSATAPTSAVPTAPARKRLIFDVSSGEKSQTAGSAIDDCADAAYTVRETLLSYWQSVHNEDVVNC